MYKLVVFSLLVVACTAAVIIPSLHYIPSSARVTNIEWKDKPVKFIVPSVPLSLHQPFAWPPYYYPFVNPFTVLKEIEKPEKKDAEKKEEEKKE
ncbi:uncharacterized protein LOC111638884 [Centruroides sculpturatus]|uniref:uncharacterized protein LOC111638884 n=1 Tax=Centruroides sculpturatus TaxID=218467 RepID=UPI000C6D0504|nr:uncharacterized protein LOC111638884 [Centruroides sculpturatus]